MNYLHFTEYFRGGKHMLGLTNIISFPFNLMKYDYTRSRTGETETKEIKVLVQRRSQQRQDSYASLSGLKTGLLSIWHTLIPVCSPCHLGRLLNSSIHIWIPPSLQIPERNFHLYLEIFHYHPSPWQPAEPFSICSFYLALLFSALFCQFPFTQSLPTIL